MHQLGVMMPPTTVQVSPEQGSLIRTRREALGQTIEQAANVAGVGSETWRRYELGQPIRSDKLRGVCRALRVTHLEALIQEPAGGSRSFDPDHIWTLADPSKVAKGIREGWGDQLAAALDLGHDLLGDQLRQDIDELAGRPRGTHLGEIVSWVGDFLPARWLMRYDYEFCWRLHATLTALWHRLRQPGYDGNPYLIRCPADYLVLHLMLEQAMSAVEMTTTPIDKGDLAEFLYELADEDDETLTILFSDSIHPAPNEAWHPDRWFKIPEEWTEVLRHDAMYSGETASASADELEESPS
jgi:transcriptional regulator with XRE-family HTH domain